MSTEVGTAYVTLVPSAKGFAARMQAELGGDIGRMGTTGGQDYSGRFSDSAGRGITSRSKGMFAGMAAGAVAGAGVAAAAAGVMFVKSAVGLEAQFSQTMNTMAAVADVPKDQMKDLSDLALKMGADTTFSAVEAGNAMLELAKGGISAADIKAGALKGTLTLAAAGGLDLASASTIASNAMNTFNLKGTDMGEIAAALAGGANASSASVESLGEALSQVGPGAKNAGLSLQETVGVLSAFDAAGIKGSDAGTSLKTMLTRLDPASEAASKAMAEVGLWTEKTGSAFVNADGSFKSVAQVAGLLQKNLGGLSEAQRSAALSAIFGSDATRAASVLMDEGAAGIEKYTAATRDKDAAERVAAARMSGTAGAIESLKGSWETLQLQAGLALQPASEAAAKFGANVLNGIVPAVKSMGPTFDKIGPIVSDFFDMFKSEANGDTGEKLGKIFTDLKATITEAVDAIVAVWQSGIGQNVIQYAKTTLKNLITIVSGVVTTIRGIVQVFVGVFTGDWAKAWEGVKNIFRGVGGILVGIVRQLWNLILLAVKNAGIALTNLFSSIWGGIKSLAKSAASGLVSLVVGGFNALVNYVKSVPGKITALGSKFGAAGKAIITAFVNGLKGAGGFVSGIAGNIWNALRGMLNSAIAKINSALQFTFDTHVPGVGKITIDPPDIQPLATGGRATGATLAVFGEGQEPETVFPDSVLGGFLERMAAASGGNAGVGSVNVRVFIGREELTDIIRSEIYAADSMAGQIVRAGR